MSIQRLAKAPEDMPKKKKKKKKSKASRNSVPGNLDQQKPQHQLPQSEHLTPPVE